MKSIRLNLIYNILLNISKVIFPLITAPYVSRVLEPDGIGLFNFANTYANYFALFAGLGIPLYGVREIAKIRDNLEEQTKFVSEILSVSIVATLICSTAFLLSLFFIPQLSFNKIIFVIAGITLYTTPFRIDWFFSGKEEFGYITFRALVVKTFSVIALFFVVKDKNDLINYIILNVIAMVVNELWNFIKLKQSGVRPRFILKSATRHFKPLLILFSSSIAISVYTALDTLMLGFMTDYTEVGYYNSATHVSKVLLPITTSLATVAMPRLSYYVQNRLWDDINSLIGKSLSVVSFLCFPIAFGVIAVAPIFVPLFYGDLFMGAVFPLQIVICVVIAIGLNNLTGVQVLVGLGYDKLFLYSVLIGMCFNFMLNLLLIPNFGASGAAFASVFAELLILFITGYFVIRKTPIRFIEIREVVVSIFCSLTFFPLIYFLEKYINGWLLVFIFICTGGFIYILLQWMCKNSVILIMKNVFLKKK